MLFSDKTSLILCGVLVAIIFCTGILQILGNYIVLTVISVILLALCYNILYTKQKLK